jgi:hypothetical protein
MEVDVERHILSVHILYHEKVRCRRFGRHKPANKENSKILWNCENLVGARQKQDMCCKGQ